jgi:hypothetical protein
MIPLPPRPSIDGRVRWFVIHIFEAVCLLFIVLPTLLCAVAALGIGLTGGEAAGVSLLITLGVLVATSFIAGGALTLVDIAYNTRQTTMLLRALQRPD